MLRARGAAGPSGVGQLPSPLGDLAVRTARRLLALACDAVRAWAGMLAAGLGSGSLCRCGCCKAPGRAPPVRGVLALAHGASCSMRWDIQIDRNIRRVSRQGAPQHSDVLDMQGD